MAAYVLCLTLCPHETGQETQRNSCRHLCASVLLLYNEAGEGWEMVSFSTRSTRTLTHATQMLEAPRRDRQELETGSLHTCGELQRLPPAAGCTHHQQRVSRAGLQPHTAASLAGLTPPTFLMNPMIPFQRHYYRKLHSIVRDESLVIHYV